MGMSAPEPQPNLSPEQREEAYQKLMDYALRALTARAHSGAELRKKLLKRDPEDLYTETILARLEHLGYLNDAELARSEAARRGVGAYRVQARLKQRGLDAELIEETLQARDPERDLEEARELLAKRMPALLRGKNARSRAYGFLARRGYDSGIVGQVVGEQQWPQEKPAWARQHDE